VQPGESSGEVVQVNSKQRDSEGQPEDQPGSPGWLVNTTISGRTGVSLKSVHMCESGSHLFVLWDKSKPETSTVKFVPFRCRSWRHEGECQRFKGAQDFVRVSDGILSRGDRWVYLVPTFNHRQERSEWEVYKDGVHRWKKLEKRLTRRFGRVEYVQTWEKHTRSDFPHVNLVIHNDRIWEECQGDGWRKWRQFLKPHLVECGFGPIIHVEPLRKDTGAGLAGYLTKLSRELTGASVKNQVPVNAPPHFRRIRASRGLLPPVYHSNKYQGVMLPSRAVGQVDLSTDGIKKLVEMKLKGVQ
jgi:hypothetical protein